MTQVSSTIWASWPHVLDAIQPAPMLSGISARALRDGQYACSDALLYHGECTACCQSSTLPCA